MDCLGSNFPHRCVVTVFVFCEVMPNYCTSGFSRNLVLVEYPEFPPSEVPNVVMGPKTIDIFQQSIIEI